MSRYSQFAGSALLHQGGGYEPQRKSNFVAIIYGVADGDIALQLKDIDVPQLGVVKKGIKYFNQTSHYAGSVEPPADWNLNYTDYIDRRGWEQLSAWYKLVFDPATGAIGRAAAYKKQGEIVLLGPDGSQVRKFALKGIMPLTLKCDGFDNEDDGSPQMIQLVCSVDLILPPGM